MSKTAIVLAGGGSRGAYQLGVWKALREMGVDYQLVTGTSVGALNGTLMVQQDYEKACQVWENITSEDIVGDMLAEKGDLNDHQLNRIFAREALEKGGADISYLEKFVYSLLDEEKFWNSEIDFALVTVEYPSLKPLELKKKDIPKGMLGEYLLASAACFPAFQTKEINGQRYIDGGYHDNMPVNLAIEMGADEIIAVDLESVGVSRKIKKGNQRVTLIRSLWPLGSFLKFDGSLAKKNIRLGYLDTLKAFGSLDGQLYAFEKDSAFFYTSALRSEAEKLFERARKREPKIFSGIHTVLMRRMLREFRRRSLHTRAQHSFTLSRQLMMAAEYLGETCRMNPEEVYEFGHFLELLQEHVAEYRRRPFPQDFSDLRKVGEELKKIDKIFLVLLIRERIERYLQGGGTLGELVFASAFWREFVAAIFLYLIEHLPKEEFILEE